MKAIAKEKIIGKVSKVIRAEKGDTLKIIQKRGSTYIAQKGNLPPFAVHEKELEIINE